MNFLRSFYTGESPGCLAGGVSDWRISSSSGGVVVSCGAWWSVVGRGFLPRDVKVVSCVKFVVSLAAAVVKYDLVGWKERVWFWVQMLHATVLWFRPELRHLCGEGVLLLRLVETSSMHAL